MFSLAFFLMILHISAYSLFNVAVFTISHRFAIRARVGDGIFDFSGLLIALDILDALCWIMFVMVAFVVSSSSYDVSNRFFNSRWNSIFFDPIWWPHGRHFFLSTPTSNLMLLTTFLLLLPMLTLLISVTSVTTSGLFVRK